MPYKKVAVRNKHKRKRIIITSDSENSDDEHEKEIKNLDDDSTLESGESSLSGNVHKEKKKKLTERKCSESNIGTCESHTDKLSRDDCSSKHNNTFSESENETQYFEFKCIWINDKLIEEKELIIYQNKNNTVADLLEEARKLVDFSENGSGKLRLLEIISYKICSVLREDLPLSSLTEKHYSNKQCFIKQLRVEEIPREEINMAKDEFLIPVAHYQKEVLLTYGVPFLLKVKLNESFYKVKERIQKKLQVFDKEFVEFAFALIVKGKPEPLPRCINISDFASDSLPGDKCLLSSWLGINHKNKDRGSEVSKLANETQAKCRNVNEFKSELFKCTWVNSKLKKEEELILPLRLTDTVYDLLIEVKKAMGLSKDSSPKLRLLEIFNHRIISMHSENMILEYLAKSVRSQNSTLRVEKIPGNEISLAEDELLLPVAHYQKVFYADCGVPFLLKVKHQEKFSNVKERIKEKLEVSDEEFEKYKFVLVDLPKPQLLRDTDHINLSDFAQHIDTGKKFQAKVWIGIDHYNINVRELRNKTQFKCTWVNNKLEVEKELVLHLSRINTVTDLLEEAKKQVDLSENGSGKLRLLYTVNCKIYSMIREARSYETLDEPKFHIGPLWVQEIRSEEIKIAKEELLISVGHYEKDVSSTFGVPFLIKVKNKEPFSQVKERIQKNLCVSDKEFKTYKFALIVSERPQHLHDAYFMNTSDFTMPGVLTGDKPTLLWPWLGIDHINKHPKKPRYNLRKRMKTH